MKLILLQILVYAFVYIAFAALIVGVTGIVSLLFRKPFTDRWRHNLLPVALLLGTGMLAEFLPRGLLLAAGLPAGILLLGGILWVFVKYRSVSIRQESTFDKNSV